MDADDLISDSPRPRTEIQQARVPQWTAPVGETRDPSENGLLSALPADVRIRLVSSFKPVVLTTGISLDLDSRRIGYLYFPCDCVVSMRREMFDGSCADIAVIGSEGVIGAELLITSRSRSSFAVVHTPGKAIRVPLRIAQEEFNRGGAFQRLILKFTQALHSQAAQAALCKRLHTIEQDLCRWLLLLHDRARTKKLRVTHEQIAISLGVRREGITLAMGALQAVGLVNCGRGQVSITNRLALEQHGCDCHRITCNEYQQIFGDVWTAPESGTRHSEEQAP